MDELALRQALKRLVTLYDGEQAALAALTLLDENGVSPSSLFEMEYRDIR